VIKDGHIFLLTKKWFGNALLKAMKTSFKAVLLIMLRDFVTVQDKNSLG